MEITTLIISERSRIGPMIKHLLCDISALNWVQLRINFFHQLGINNTLNTEFGTSLFRAQWSVG